MRLKKRMLGIILSLVLVLGLMSGMNLTAYAANYENGQSTTYSAVVVGDTFEAGAVIRQDSGQMWLFTVYVDGNKQGEYMDDWSAGDGYPAYTVTNTITLNEKNDREGVLYFSSGASTTVGVENVSLNQSSLTLNVGETYDGFVVDITPTDATDNTITWSSNNESVATVSDGVVTAVAKGTANITVTATNGTEDTSDDKKATCAVTVNAASSGGGSSDSGSGSSSSGSSDNTNTTTDTSAKVPYDDVAISTGSVNDITGTASATAERNPFETKIENNDNLTTLLALTPEEVAQGVNVWLDIQEMSATVPQADKDLVQNASTNLTVGMYLDINLFKKVGGNTATKITETNGTVKASILIPESLWKAGRTFEIIRVHDGVPTVISGTYDENAHVFTFETDKFSTYALAYKDSVLSSASDTTSNSGSSDGSNSTQPTAPKTGDPNDIRVWYLLLIASLGGLGFLGLSKKKKVND